MLYVKRGKLTLAIRNQMVFMHNGAWAHFSCIVHRFIDERYSERWTARLADRFLWMEAP